MEKNNIKFDIDRKNDYSHIDSDIKIEYGKDENKDIYYSNISRTIIMITEDRLKLNAIEYENSIAAKKKIVTSFSFFISILLTLATSDFHDFLGIDASVISALFISFLILSVICLAYNIFLYIYHRVRNDYISDKDDFVLKCRS